MQLKRQYSAREVAALTGLTSRQLQWWDVTHVFSPTVGPRRTEAGGFTERRYSPVELLELLVLAELRRRGFSLHKIRTLLTSLRERFGVRLIDAVGGEGPLMLLTDGQEIFVRTAKGEFFNLLRDPTQPLLAIGQERTLKALTSKVRPKRMRRQRARGGRSRTKSDGA